MTARRPPFVRLLVAAVAVIVATACVRDGTAVPHESDNAGTSLTELGAAFRSIGDPGRPFVRTDGHREYGRFSILVTDPPPWEGAQDPGRPPG